MAEATCPCPSRHRARPAKEASRNGVVGGEPLKALGAAFVTLEPKLSRGAEEAHRVHRLSLGVALEPTLEQLQTLSVLTALESPSRRSKLTGPEGQPQVAFCGALRLTAQQLS